LADEVIGVEAIVASVLRRAYLYGRQQRNGRIAVVFLADREPDRLIWPLDDKLEISSRARKRGDQYISLVDAGRVNALMGVRVLLLPLHNQRPTPFFFLVDGQIHGAGCIPDDDVAGGFFKLIAFA